MDYEMANVSQPDSFSNANARSPEACASMDESVRAASSTASPEKEHERCLRLVTIGNFAEIPSPAGLRRGTAALHDGVLYVASNDSQEVYMFNVKDGSWARAPSYRYTDFQLTVFDGLLTGVGGRMLDDAQTPTGDVYSLIDGEWKPRLPALATPRSESAVISDGDALIVIGGVGEGAGGDKTFVEVIRAGSHEWLAACPLPERLEFPSAALCGDRVYVVEGDGNVVYSCRISTLLGWSQDAAVDVWTRVADVPTRWSTTSHIAGQLVAVGGWEVDDEPTPAIYAYVPGEDYWSKIGELTEPRDLVVVAPINEGRVLVVGGSRSPCEDCCIVEDLRLA